MSSELVKGWHHVVEADISVWTVIPSQEVVAQAIYCPSNNSSMIQTAAGIVQVTMQSHKWGHFVLHCRLLTQNMSAMENRAGTTKYAAENSPFMFGSQGHAKSISMSFSSPTIKKLIIVFEYKSLSSSSFVKHAIHFLLIVCAVQVERCTD